jgi:hypothetical protein
MLSATTGPLHVAPLYVAVSPLVPTVTQKRVVGHDTDMRPLLAVTTAGTFQNPVAFHLGAPYGAVAGGTEGGGGGGLKVVLVVLAGLFLGAVVTVLVGRAGGPTRAVVVLLTAARLAVVGVGATDFVGVGCGDPVFVVADAGGAGAVTAGAFVVAVGLACLDFAFFLAGLVAIGAVVAFVVLGEVDAGAVEAVVVDAGALVVVDAGPPVVVGELVGELPPQAERDTAITPTANASVKWARDERERLPNICRLSPSRIWAPAPQGRDQC